MKNIFIAFFLFAALKANAQTDSTKIKSIQLQAKVIEYIIAVCMNPENDSLYQVYIDLRPKFRIKNHPTNNTLVTIDSIPTVELANLYNYVLSNSDGLGMGNNVRNGITAARASNSYLDRLCTQYELFWSNRLDALRTSGQRILRGK